MILKSIKVEHVDPMTGLVLKRIKTTEWEHLNHKMAVNNSLFECELNRIVQGKHLLNTPFQVHHIFYHKSRRYWHFDGIAESKAHAALTGRFYLPFQQRSSEQWEALTFAEAEADFQDLATRGLPLVPYPIPLNATPEQWVKRKADAQALLNNSQRLVPIFCSKHQADLFEEIFNHEFLTSQIIGVQCYGLNDATTLLNLSRIKLRNARLQAGDDAPLLVALNFDKVLRTLSCVSGSFAYACFGFDILSARQMNMKNLPPEVIATMMSKEIEEIMKYDSVLGGFALSAEQEFYDGVNVTRRFLENVNVTEGLNAYQAIQWANFYGQQNDFDELNQYILQTATAGNEDVALKHVQHDKEKWAVLWQTKVAPAQ